MCAFLFHIEIAIYSAIYTTCFTLVLDKTHYQNINVMGNVKSFNAIRKEMVSIENHLKSIATLDELSLDKIESIRTIFEILDSYYRGAEQHLEI